MNIIVKLAEKGDYNDLALIYAKEFSKEPFNENWTLNKALKKIDLWSLYCDIFSIFEDEFLIGFIVVNRNFWDFEECVYGEDIAIKEEYQNKGIGKVVFNQIFDYYKIKGFKKFYGILVAERLKFYEDLGFKVSKDNLFAEKVL
jgi:GNAT superfamily N-acetyltransferase